MAIKGYLTSKENGKRPLIIVGKTTTKFAEKLLHKYGKEPNVRFIGGIYNFQKLNSVRKFSYAYFHCHSVGGTNPSLLEAMASECFILAHDNIFNRAVLKQNAHYYDSAAAITNLLNNIETTAANTRDNMLKGNLDEIRNNYSWEHLVDLHEEYFKSLLERK